MFRNLTIAVFLLASISVSGQQPCPWFNYSTAVSYYRECVGGQYYFGYGYQNASYLWSTGSTHHTLMVTQTGWYWVDITIDGCTARDSNHVTFATPYTSQLDDDTTVCEGLPIQLIAGDDEYATYYTWNNGGHEPSITVSEEGTYIVEIYNGCTVFDTIVVKHRKIPKVNFGPDKFLCENDGFWLNSGFSDADFLWQDGHTGANYYATQPGTYYVTATNDCGTDSDTVQVIPSNPPTINLGPDISICDGTTVLLDAGSSGSQRVYNWSTGSHNQQINAPAGGTYWVNVREDGCSASDTIKIGKKYKPSFSLGSDEVFCEGSPVSISVDLPGTDLLWSDGSTGPSLQINAPGNYFLTASNECGSTVDSIFFKHGICKLLLPSAFSPNGDGLNDIFRIPPALGINIRELSVYTRWGERVFTTSDANVGWNGLINGSPAPVGVYVYYVKAMLPEGEADDWGTFTLVR